MTRAPSPAATRQRLGPCAWLLRGFALAQAPALLAALQDILERAPLRHMVTPGGQRMSVAMSNCGALGWTSDRRGYRYRPDDPLNDRPWPALPPEFLRLAAAAAGEAGCDGFKPDACLINRYLPGNRLSLHQDRDERDLTHPIVSLSLGLPAVFLFGGMARSDRAQRVLLEHGDAVVWGGADRLRFHGVLPLKDPQAGRQDDLLAATADVEHELLRGCRINLTFRKAG
jgi:alkylated DNA repair protein (DNA oxidative demethylase)